MENWGEAWWQLRAWLVANPHWILLCIGAMAALEAVAIVGAIVPGVALMLALSLLAGSAGLDIWAVLSVGMVGAMAGDGISYAIGHHFKHRIEGVWPFRSHPQWLAAAEAFVQRHGGKSLIFGRFIGPLRAFVPLAAGIFHMPLGRFLWFNFLSAVAWAPVHILPGYTVGAAVTHPLMPGRQQLLLVGGLLILIAALTWLIPWLGRVSRSWRARHAPHNQGWVYAADGLPENQLAALLLAGLSLLLFAGIALTLPWLKPADLWLAAELGRLRQPAMDQFFLAFSLLGEKAALLSIGGVLLTWLLLRREWRTAGFALLLGALCLSLPALLKLGFAIPRPGLVNGPPGSYAFPSGHAFTATVVWGFFYVVVTRRLPEMAKPVVLAVALSVMVLTAASRPLLGVHWGSDVLAGLCLGLACLALLRWAWYRGPGLRWSQPWEAPLALLTGLALVATVWLLPEWQSALWAYQPLGEAIAAPLSAD